MESRSEQGQVLIEVSLVMAALCGAFLTVTLLLSQNKTQQTKFQFVKKEKSYVSKKTVTD